MIILAITIMLFGALAFNMNTRVEKMAYRIDLVELQQIVNNGNKQTTEEIHKSIELVKKYLVEEKFRNEESETVAAWLRMLRLHNIDLTALNFNKKGYLLLDGIDKGFD